MSSKPLLLSTLLLASYCVTVRSGSTITVCPNTPEAPSSGNSVTRNVPVVDTDHTVQGLRTETPLTHTFPESFSFILRSQCPARYEACHTTPQDNHLIAPIQAINTNGLRIHTVEARFDFTLNCNDSNCSNSFGLYSLNYDGNPSELRNFSAYIEVTSSLNSGTPVSITCSMTASHLAVALRDTGTCVTVNRVQVYYHSCVVDFAAISEIPFGNDGVTLTCVPNTVTSSVTASCSETGVLSPATLCECQAGYSGGDGMNCIGKLYSVYVLFFSSYWLFG